MHLKIADRYVRIPKNAARMNVLNVYGINNANLVGIQVGV